MVASMVPILCIVWRRANIFLPQGHANQITSPGQIPLLLNTYSSYESFRLVREACCSSFL